MKNELVIRMYHTWNQTNQQTRIYLSTTLLAQFISILLSVNATRNMLQQEYIAQFRATFFVLSFKKCLFFLLM